MNYKNLLTTFSLCLGLSMGFSQNVGVGEPNPAAKLSVKGNASIGTNYSTIAAPADGAIIEGNVGIGTTIPDASAKLDISTSDKGILLPRVALSATNVASPVTTPAMWLTVFNTATAGSGATAVTPGFYYWNGTNWIRLITTDNDIQDVSLSSNILSLSNDATPVDLTPYLDNTDAQTLSYNGLTGNLSISNGNTVNIPVVSDTDDQTLTYNNVTGDLTIVDGNTVNLNGIKDHDWYEVGTTTAPDNINDNMYHLGGNVAIGNNAPAYKLDVTGGARVAWSIHQDDGTNGFNMESRAGLGYDFWSLHTVSGGVAEFSKNITLLRATGNVGINNTAPDASAKLDIFATDRGMLIPRVALANTGTFQLTGATNTTSMLVYNNNAAIAGTNAAGVGYYYWDGTSWTRLQNGSTSANDWHITGNIGTNVAANFLGTIDNVALHFRTNNIFSGEINPNGATFLGHQAGLSNATVVGFNTYIGASAGKDNTVATTNVALGYSALSSTSGNNNVALGASTMTTTAGTKYENVAVGNAALRDVSNGFRNVAIGHQTMASATLAANNTAVGWNALKFATNTSSNVAIGDYAMSAGTASGGSNVAVGTAALNNVSTGTQNVAIGRSALTGTTTASDNVTVGTRALQNNLAQSRNIGIGTDALASQSFATAFNANNIAIGYRSLFANQPTSSLNGINNIALGNDALDENTTGNRNIGIGTDALGANTSGVANVAIGRDALQANLTTSQNTAIGTEALKSVVGGINNTAIGYQAFNTGISGSNNTFIGSNVAQNNTADNNVAIGASALTSNTTATQNTAIGTQSMLNITTGGTNTAMGYQSFQGVVGDPFPANATSNVALGVQAMQNAQNDPTATGISTTPYMQFNVAMGYQSLRNNRSSGNIAIGYTALSALNNIGASRNIAIGQAAMSSANGAGAFENVAIGYNSLAVNTSSLNTAIGSRTMQANTTGQRNTALGYQSMQTNTIGNFNVAIGAGALLSNVDGNENVSVGRSAMSGSDKGNRSIAIGVSALQNVNATYLAPAVYNAENIAIGYLALADINAPIGPKSNTAPTALINAQRNIGIGNRTVQYTKGIDNIGIGHGAIGAGDLANYTVAVGNGAFNQLGDVSLGNVIATDYYSNIGVGYQVGASLRDGKNNIFMGHQAGYSSLHGIANVFIGYQAGYSEMGDNKLIIENSNNITTPLIGGDFGTNKVAINGVAATNTLYINGGTIHTSNNWQGAVELNIANAIEWKPNASTKTFGMGYTTNGFYMYNAVDNLGANANPAAYRMIIHDNGGMAIGANMGAAYTPTAPLHVEGFTNSGVGNFAYFAFAGCNNQGCASGTTDVSIYATNRVRASEFNAFSDARIKNIKDISNPDQDLATLAQIEVTNYTHIDVVGKGNESKKGFIAQQVETIFPEAVSKAKDFIPNVYAAAEKIVFINGNTNERKMLISLTQKHDFTNGDIVKIIADKIYEKEVVVIDEKTFMVDAWENADEKVFVYGKQVSDFRAVDYDRIFTLNVSATQALLKRVKALEVEKGSLLQRVEALEAKVGTPLSNR